MKEVFNKELFKLKVDVIVIPSHGYVTLHGEHFADEGPAKKVKRKWKVYPSILGFMLKFHGNHVFQLTKSKKKEKRIGKYEVPWHILHMPIKPAGGIHKDTNVEKPWNTMLKRGEPIPGYKMKVSIELVEQSCKELNSLAKERKWKKIAIAKPQMRDSAWKKVRKILRKRLDSRYLLIVEEGK